MNMRDSLVGGLARQLGHPRGLPGRLVAVMLNKANRATVTAAVEALDLHQGETAADIGFGGGLGLALLLDCVGANGVVHGVDISALVLARARRRFRSATSAGRLFLHSAPMTRLPMTDASVQAVMTVNTIYFARDLDLALAELRRVLGPTGRAVIGLGEPAAMADEPVAAHGFILRHVPDVVEAMHTVGLTVTDHQRIGDGNDAFHLLISNPDRSGRDRTP